MSEPVIAFVESRAFNRIGTRTRMRTTSKVWRAIRIRMAIPDADQALILEDIIESAMLARHV